MNDELDPVVEPTRDDDYEPPSVVESARFETVARACLYGPPPNNTAPGCTFDNTQ